MDLYFLRHGDAVDIGAPGVRTDAQRHLSDDGVAKCRAAAAGLAWLVERFDVVLSSPLVRARQTAELVVPGVEIELDDTLAGATPEALLARLAKLPAEAAVLLVGHEPQFSMTVEKLLGVPFGAGLVAMKKAGLAHLTVDLRRWPRQPAELLCLLAPRQLRRLGGA